MRFNFDVSDSDSDEQLQPNTSSVAATCDTEWIPLQDHPVFRAEESSFPTSHGSRNVLSWDGISRLYLWDNNSKCLHRVTLRLGDPQPTSVLAASPSKVIRPDVALNFQVRKIALNKNGSALFLAGVCVVNVMYLHGHSSTKHQTMWCRTVSVGSSVFSDSTSSIHLLQVAWHPNSYTHLGILSSDSIFRIFDISSSYEKPEQEYYLQPSISRFSRNTSVFPVDFCFGGHHLWDRFSVFFLFGDGSIYIICPVVPFGSVHSWESIMEIHRDAQVCGVNLTDSTASKNLNLALSWLEKTFSEIPNSCAIETGKSPVLKARPPISVFDSSVLLQGPLHRVCRREEDISEIKAEGEGRHAVSFLCNTVGKDLLIVTEWSGGLVRVDALVDEVQPVWNPSADPPRVRPGPAGHTLAVAMICDPLPGNSLHFVKLDEPQVDSPWLGRVPPLLRLAAVDLDLDATPGTSVVSLYSDPLMPERIYAVHGGGVDSILVHFLPFTKPDCHAASMRSPSVCHVLDTCPGNPSPELRGFAALSDPFGYSWVVGVTPQECVLLEMRTWDALLPTPAETETREDSPEEGHRCTVISRELLSGPLPFRPTTPSDVLRSVSPESVEGRTILHRYFDMFHEKYVEYAHKVYFEVKHQGPYLRKINDDLQLGMCEVKKKLKLVEKKHGVIGGRITQALRQHECMDERLQRLRKLPGFHRRPLTRAEREFKLEMDRMEEEDIKGVRNSIEVLEERMRRQGKNAEEEKRRMRAIGNRRGARRVRGEEDEFEKLKFGIEKLSLINRDNSGMVTALDSALRRHEI